MEQFSLSYARVYMEGDALILWEVRGISNRWYATKAVAEAAAHRVFPGESDDMIEARLVQRRAKLVPSTEREARFPLLHDVIDRTDEAIRAGSELR